MGGLEFLVAVHPKCPGKRRVLIKILITLRAKLSGTVYCNRYFLGLFVCVCGFVCLWVCYHDNSKLHASILTKLGL